MAGRALGGTVLFGLGFGGCWLAAAAAVLNDFDLRWLVAVGVGLVLCVAGAALQSGGPAAPLPTRASLAARGGASAGGAVRSAQGDGLLERARARWCAGDLAGAADLLRQGADHFRTVPGGGPRRAEALYELGAVRFEQGDLQAAEALRKEAGKVDIMGPTQPRPTMEAVGLLLALGQLLHARLLRAQALAGPAAERSPTLEAALENARNALSFWVDMIRDPGRRDATTLLIGQLLLDLEKLDEATSTLTRLRIDLEAVDGPPEHVAACLDLLAELAGRRGDAADAEAKRAQAAAARAKASPPPGA